MTDDTGTPPRRKPYHQPQLHRYGLVQSLTQTGGTHGADDALHGSAGKTG